MVLSAVDVSNLLQATILKTKILLQRHYHKFKKFSKGFDPPPSNL